MCVLAMWSCCVLRPSIFEIFKGGSMPNTSSSVPYLLSSSMNSIRSRRQSTCSQNSSTGILQQLGSGVVKQLSTLQNPVNIILLMPLLPVSIVIKSNIKLIEIIKEKTIYFPSDFPRQINGTLVKYAYCV